MSEVDPLRIQDAVRSGMARSAVESERKERRERT